MKILAFETSAKAGSVAALEGQTLIAEAYLNTGLTHSQTLLTMAEDLMKTCQWTAEDVQAVAVAAGPGSFTGVRIGVAAAKGFAWGAQIPLYGVSTLEAMALQLGAFEGYVLAVMDARRNQVYSALFQAEQGQLTRLCQDRAISLSDLEKELKILKKPIFLVGDGSILCYNALKEQVPNLVLPPEHRLHQRAAGVGLAAWQEIREGKTGDASALQPNYLRLSQAERERLEKEKSLQGTN